ncbi:DUF4174 domain-containing protein [Falsihalocynthiibacter sp. S25ZX9]|uniref:DUF4174 domain-containing protein n=1 Tax=Falsihalocynthiibacter sp. S25ZX9 TaxID=3240870 RepID=UPI00350EFF1B
MKILTLVFLAVAGVSFSALAEETRPFDPIDAQDTTLEDLKWVSRPILLFAARPDDLQIERQLELLQEQWPALVARDVVVVVDTDPKGESDVRNAIRPHGFMMVLMDKDGTIAQRKPHPWSARELIRAIDKMPLRLEEEKERRIVNPRAVQ